jgi:hypothetical protein
MGIAKLVDPDQATVGPQEIDNERTMANKIVRAE